MTTLITHTWNEAALLPGWLEWHLPRFERIIAIDCQSDDGTRDLLHDAGVEVVEGPDDFGAARMDGYVMRVEEQVTGPRIALNATEFLLGDPDRPGMTFIPSISLIDMGNEPEFDWLSPWWLQRWHGIGWREDFMLRRSRLLTDAPVRYDIGRHFMQVSEAPLLIVHVANCLVDEQMIARRLAIQTRIPATDVALDLSFQHHAHGMGLTRERLMAEQAAYRARATDLTAYLEDVA